MASAPTGLDRSRGAVWAVDVAAPVTTVYAELWCATCSTWRDRLDRDGRCEACAALHATQRVERVDPVTEALAVGEELLGDLTKLNADARRLLKKWGL